MKNGMKKIGEKLFSQMRANLNLHGPDGRDYVRRRSGEAFHPGCLRSTCKSILLDKWSGAAFHILVLDTYTLLIVQNYINILKHNLLPTIRNQFGGPKKLSFSR